MTITLEVVMIARQINPFFIYSLSSIRWYISFLVFQNLRNSISLGSPLLHYVLACKIHIYMPNNDTLNPVIIDILFLHNIC